MKSIKRWLWQLFSIELYILIALENEKVREIQLFFSEDSAKARAEKLRVIYGGANVCFASRFILK